MVVGVNQLNLVTYITTCQMRPLMRWLLLSTTRGGDLSDATLDEMAAFIYNEGGGSLLPPGDIKLLKGS